MKLIFADILFTAMVFAIAGLGAGAVEAQESITLPPQRTRIVNEDVHSVVLMVHYLQYWRIYAIGVVGMQVGYLAWVAAEKSGLVKTWIPDEGLTLPSPVYGNAPPMFVPPSIPKKTDEP